MASGESGRLIFNKYVAKMVNGVMKSAPAGTLDAWSPPADAADDGDDEDALIVAMLEKFPDNDVENADFDNNDVNDDNDDDDDVDDDDDDDDDAGADDGDNW
jgi:hypothetical protein